MDPPSVKQIIQTIDVQMQTTHNQSRSQPAPTAPPVRTGAGHVIFVARRAIDLLASQGAWAGTRNASNRRVSSCCWSAGLVMDRKTIPGNTRGACQSPRCTGIAAVRACSPKTQTRRCRSKMPRRSANTIKKQRPPFSQVLRLPVYLSLWGPGRVPAKAKLAPATCNTRHRPRTPRITPDDDES